MPEIGQMLSHYRIVDKIGQGGMGEVYLADDTTLDRKIALKFLPEAFTSDPERMARFEREAKLLASLNHPNIAGIYGLEQADGNRFLVLEYVEGETLQARLSKGELPLEDALDLCRQIAEGLEEAHEKGVIHRDLKPANVMITSEEKVKILDFGLAKAFANEQSDLNLSNSPTLSLAATQQGIILGTAGYMSPEQARGKPVDKRADIWAFGVVLFEMLTGKQVFTGDTVSDTLASVLAREPEWQSLPANLHPRIRLLLERCLEKEANIRYHDIADARVDIQDVLADPSGVFAQPRVLAKPNKRLRLSMPWVAGIAILCLIIASLAGWILRPPEPRQVQRYTYNLPKDTRYSQPDRHAIAISADGLKIVYIANNQIYLKNADKLTAMPVEGINGVPANPFFSPDGTSIGYFDLNSHELKRIPVTGGIPEPLCRVTQPVGATWGDNDEIVYGEVFEGIMKISANGGNPDKIVAIESEQNIICPQILPDGKSVLFTIMKDNQFWVVVQSLESKERHVLFQGGPAQYLSTGHLIYGNGNSLFAILFDIDSLIPKGDPRSVIDGVFRVAQKYQTQSAISESGTLIYIPGSTSLESQIKLYDRDGNLIETVGKPANYRQLSLSPNGRSIVIERDGDLWVLDLDRGGIGTRITFTPNLVETDPIWSPDSNSIAFHCPSGIYRKSLVGGKGPELLLKSKENQLLIPEDWSDDDRFIVYLDANGQEVEAISILPLSDGQAPKMLFTESFNYDEPKVSPDGKWLTYMSSETNGLPEVYIRPLADNGRQQRISTGGGGQPQWSKDGKELCYLSPDGYLMAVEIEMRGNQLIPGKTNTLFQTGIMVDLVQDQFAVTGDGESFYVLTPSQTIDIASINIVLNWFEELKEKVPVH